MSSGIDQEFLDYSVDKLCQLAQRIESCLGRLTAEQVWARGGENENAIGNLVLHLCGNVRQWIVASVGGAPDRRVRDWEFDTREAVPVADLVAQLRSTISDAVAALEQVTEERLMERITVQQYHLSVLQAIYHVVEHFSGHTAQILFVTKMLTGADLGFYRHLRATADHGETTP